MLEFATICSKPKFPTEKLTLIILYNVIYKLESNTILVNNSMNQSQIVLIFKFRVAY